MRISEWPSILAVWAALLTWTGSTAPAQQPQQEPVPVAGAIQEAKLIRRVDPICPARFRSLPVRGPVRLRVVVDGQGQVSEARIIGGGHPTIQLPVLQAVRQWRYFPTYANGKAIPIITDIAAGCDNPASGLALYLMADEHGGLRTAEMDTDGKWIPGGLVPDARLRLTKGQVFLVVFPEIALAKIEQAAKVLYDSGITDFQFQNRDFVYKDGRVYCVGDANGIRPPDLGIKAGELASIALASGLLGTATGLAYHIFVDESGKITALERFDGPRIPEVETAMEQARVVTLGRRGEQSVLVMITLALQFRE